MKKFNITGLVIASTCALIALYDLAITQIDGHYDNSVSHWVFVMSHDWPILTFLTGIMAGHFFFPMASDKANAKKDKEKITDYEIALTRVTHAKDHASLWDAKNFCINTLETWKE